AKAVRLFVRPRRVGWTITTTPTIDPDDVTHQTAQQFTDSNPQPLALDIQQSQIATRQPSHLKSTPS
ncbi:hypothetical protein, partial [Pseudomonas syringae group genomosp. 7]|uniref:hypothetical protein n=1 Tax=Pseudomonas syringae group genomosp. 7 TaxID=251699 RepID=UPI0037703A2A